MSRRRRGWVVVLAGPDGTGKSTVADILVDELEARGKQVARQHYRPNYLFRREGDAVVSSDPHASAPRSKIAGRAKLAVTALDTWVGLRRARRKVDVVLVERGWWDQVVDPARYRLQGSQGFARGLGRLLPKADALIHLTGDMGAVAVRKPELALAELTRQDDVWGQLAEVASRDCLRVSTTCPVEETTQALLGVVDALADPRWWLKRLRPGPRRLHLTASDLRRETLFVYRPQTGRARAAMATARCLGVAQWRRQPALLAAVGGRFTGFTPHGLATFRGSARGRRIVGALSLDGDAVLKINDQPDSDLDNEVATLARRLDLAGLTPKVLTSGSIAGIRFLLTRRVIVDPAAPELGLTDVAGICARLQAGDDPVVHGDLAPWNLMVGSHGPVLLDWESAVRRRAPAYDACFYVVSKGALLGAWSPVEAANRLCVEVMPAIATALAVDSSFVRDAVLEALAEIGALADDRSDFASACREVMTCVS